MLLKIYGANEMHVNWSRRELSFKIVYHGPALSGKTTNLIAIHEYVPEKNRSDLVSLDTEGDRTLFFDFLQLELGEVAGFMPRVQLYTVPGQVQYKISRKLVLRGTDGIIFVADSASEKMDANLAAWQDLQNHLRSYNRNLKTMPIVIQLNKRDLKNRIDPHDLKAKLDLDSNLMLFEAIASEGQGVFETMKAAIGLVVGHLQNEVDLTFNPNPPAQRVQI
jgi:signal recognition particle receptor subunit beta